MEDTVRKNVTRKRPQVWKYRGYTDAYTGKSRAAVEKSTPQVDHILEIQMLDKVWQDAPVAARTRKGHEQFSKVGGNRHNKKSLVLLTRTSSRWSTTCPP